MAIKRLPELIVDFNEMDRKRRVTAHLVDENAGKAVAPGEEVLLQDDEGATCRGSVVRVVGREALIQPEWATWRDPHPIRMKPSAHPPESEMYYALVSRVGQFSASPGLTPKRPKTRAGRN